MPRSIVVDVSRLPIVVTTITGAMQLDDVLEMQRVFAALFASGAKFSTITDARRMSSMPNAALRRVITDWNVRFEQATREQNVAASAIFESALARAALRAIHWIAPHPTPYAVVATMDEALAFALSSLERAGIAIPSTAEVRAIRDAAG